MRAALMQEYGEPLVLDEVAAPQLEDDNDVIVRIAAAGVCGSDVHIRSGAHVENLGRADMPYRLGHENVGFVHELGRTAAAQGFEVGDPVVLHPLISCGLCRSCRAGNDMYCEAPAFPGIDGRTHGGFAEFMRTGVRSLVPLVPGTDPVPLTPLTDAGLTAYHAVKKLLPLIAPGHTAAVVGSGGVGQFAIQLLASLTPARVIATDVSSARLEAATAAGADVVIGAEPDGDGGAAVRDLTDGRGVEVVFDCVGIAPSIADSAGMLCRGGVLSVLGASDAPVPMSTAQYTGMEISVIGNYVGTYTDLVELVALFDAGTVTCHHQRYALDDAEQALLDLAAGRMIGRGVLVP